MSESEILNITLRKIAKRQHSLDSYTGKYGKKYAESSAGGGQTRFSWTKFLKLSIAIHFVNLLNVKCNVHVHCPDKQQVSHVMLLIPRLCKQTVTYTISLVAAPLKRSYSDADALWLKHISQNYIRRYWRKNQSRCARKDTKRHLFHLLKIFHLPFIPLTAFLITPARYAFKKIKIPQSITNRSKSIARTRGWQVRCYRMMPLKSLSHAWGFVNNLNLPIFLRPIILNWYVKAFGCNLSEAEVEDLTHYKNLGEFFRRRLKSNVRPIDHHSPLVSPVDGQILMYGAMEDGIIDQVKGVSYSISQFLGPPSWTANAGQIKDFSTSEDYKRAILHHEHGTTLFHAVVYLAPGDYHRFHSPVEWKATFRRHFAGELLSVNPKIAQLISGLFSLNERAVYTGSWRHGFFSFTAVGATNVGSIKVYDDTELQTNVRRQRKGQYKDKLFENPLEFKKGQNIGEFNLGSTVILIFEAPSDLCFSLKHGDRVKVGQSILQPQHSSTVSSDCYSVR